MENVVKRVHPLEGLSLVAEKQTKKGVRQRWFKPGNPVPFDITWISAQPAVVSEGDVIEHREVELYNHHFPR